MKKIFLIILITGILVSAGIGYKFFMGQEDDNFSVIEAKRKDIVEKVSVTGSLVPLKRIKIEPKVKEEVDRVFVNVSDRVEQEDLLIQLDNQEARINIDKKQSNLESVKKEINLLETQLKNTEKDLEQTKENTAQKIKQAHSSLEEAKVNLNSKKQNLEDVRKTEENQLKQVYESARVSLDSNLLTVRTALIKLNNIKKDYFTSNDQISLKVRSKIRKAEVEIEEAEELIDEAKETEENKKTEESLTQFKNALEDLKEALRYTRDEACESPLYSNDVSSTDKSILETQKSNIETAISNITTVSQNITSQKISSEKNINFAQAEVNAAKEKVATAEVNINSIEIQNEQKITQVQSKIEEIKEELNLKESKLENAKSDLEQAQKRLDDTSITAPIKGIITMVEIEEGETAKPGQVIIEIMPEEKYKIEADVSEVDMGKIKEGDEVKVDFDAFPEEEFEGKVSKVYPSEIVRQGVIYYRIEAELNQYPEKLKSGLTANLEIITDRKQNALVVPYVAVNKDDQGSYVQVKKDDQITEKRRVETGLEGETMIEIKKGLEEGEKVATYIEE